MKKLLRPNIQNMVPYTSARDAFSGKEVIALDANENPFGTMNRYPDPYQSKLKQKLAELKGIGPEHLFIGNGSDEIIDLALRIFCEPQIDKALTFYPTYGMYEVCADINNVELITVPLNQDFQIDRVQLEAHLTNENLKLIFICSPNNPTGNLIKQGDIEYILKHFHGIVLVDEAYIDFANAESSLSSIHSYDRLIVCQTMSKAWGLAAARIGIAYANAETVSLFNKVKPPYNVSELNQKAALNALDNPDLYTESIALILSERERLRGALSSNSLVKRIYPSDANFLLIEVEKPNEVYDQLIEQGIVVRNRSTQITGCLRISIGTPSENDQLLNAFTRIA